MNSYIFKEADGIIIIIIMITNLTKQYILPKLKEYGDRFSG